MKEQVAELIPIAFGIGILYYAVRKGRQRRERMLDMRVQEILRGTLRPPPQSPISFTINSVVMQLTDFQKREVRYFLQALEKRNVLQRIPYAKKRSYRDRYVLTPEAEAEMRGSLNS